MGVYDRCCLQRYLGKGIYGKISRSTCHVSVFRGQRQITEQNSTHACLAGTIPNFIIFDKMTDKLVVNSITKFDRYWSGETAQCSESPIFRNLNIPKNSREETLTGLSRI